MAGAFFDSRTAVSPQKAAEHLGLSEHSARKYADELSRYGLIDFTHR